MRLLNLTQGMVAIVDDCDFEWASKYKWHFHKSDKRDTYGYAARGSKKGGRQRIIKLHREIMSPPPGMQVDHVNGNKLDCRRENLRLATHAENCQNKLLDASRNKSGFKGVSWCAPAGKWRARIKLNRREIHLGVFDNPTTAATAYDEAAIRLFGKFACTNSTETQIQA